MKYIQSFYQYPITFSSIGKTIPARSAQGELRNLAEITERELERIQNSEPLFRELVNKKKLRVLDKMPEGYKSSAARINEAQDEIARLKAENEKLRAQQENAETEAGKDAGQAPDEPKALQKLSYPELQAKAKELGLEAKGMKKTDLIKAIEAQTEGDK